jgi:hypothetical protein
VIWRLGVLLAAPFSLTVAAAPRDATPSAPVASRIVDRAFECVNAKHRGWRKILLKATTGYRQEGRWRWLATATVENPNETPTRLPADETGFRPAAFTHWSLGLSAGTGPWTNDPALEKQEPIVSIWSKWEQACKPAPRGRVPLPPRGLQGGAAGAPVRAASFAVRTTAGRALAFVSVNDTGKARVFVGANCTG